MQIALLIFSFFMQNSSFYSLQFQDIDGNTISMSHFQGKRVLLVNIATESSATSQLQGLQQLHQQHGDSLVVIGFPSNSFANEPKSNAEIKSFCQSNYGITFLLASKNSVSGSGVQPVYTWLTNIAENGMMSNPVGGDFQKYLVDKEGKLIGVFSPSTPPNSPQLIEALSY